MHKIRKIIHIDMDAFYAAIEQRDRPELKGQPVIVGGNPDNRGVVAACSYEARKYGIHSAMSSKMAYKLCPRATFLPPRFDTYRSVSAQIMNIFREYSDLVEPLSLDEAFIDVTLNKKNIASATRIAQDICKKIQAETGLTASAGVSYNKFLAKVASDFNKPDGITVVTPKMAQNFIDKLPIRKFFGVGKVTEKKMLSMGIRTGADLRKLGRLELEHLFGKSGEYFYEISHGIDSRPVTPYRTRKSIGQEITLGKDIDDINSMLSILQDIARELEDDMQQRKLSGRTVTLKLKYHDFKSITRSITLEERTNNADIIMEHIRKLLEKTDAGAKKIRLLGITLSNLTEPVRNKQKKPSPAAKQLRLPIF